MRITPGSALEPALSAADVPVTDRPPTDAEVDAIARRSDAKDPTLTCRDAGRVVDARPYLVENLGSPAHLLITKLIDKYSYGQKINGQAMWRKYLAVEKELTGPQPSPVERLLAEQAAVCWVAANPARAASRGREGSHDRPGALPPEEGGRGAPAVPLVVPDPGGGPQARRPGPPGQHRRPERPDGLDPAVLGGIDDGQSA